MVSDKFSVNLGVIFFFISTYASSKFSIANLIILAFFISSVNSFLYTVFFSSNSTNFSTCGIIVFSSKVIELNFTLLSFNLLSIFLNFSDISSEFIISCSSISSTLYFFLISLITFSFLYSISDKISLFSLLMLLFLLSNSIICPLDIEAWYVSLFFISFLLVISFVILSISRSILFACSNSRDFSFSFFNFASSIFFKYVLLFLLFVNR